MKQKPQYETQYDLTVFCIHQEKVQEGTPKIKHYKNTVHTLHTAHTWAV